MHATLLLKASVHTCWLWSNAGSEAISGPACFSYYSMLMNWQTLMRRKETNCFSVEAGCHCVWCDITGSARCLIDTCKFPQSPFAFWVVRNEIIGVWAVVYSCQEVWRRKRTFHTRLKSELLCGKVRVASLTASWQWGKPWSLSLLHRLQSDGHSRLCKSTTVHFHRNGNGAVFLLLCN